MPKYLYAFDLSMANTGLVIFDLESFKHVLITSIGTNSKHPHGKRLHHIESVIKKYTKDFPPHVVALERGFSHRANVTQVLFRVHGVVNCLMWEYDQKYYPPKTIKLAIAGKGDAKKEKVAEMIHQKLGVTFNDEDESDAYAVGLTYMINECGMEWDIPKPIKKSKSKSKGDVV